MTKNPFSNYGNKVSPEAYCGRKDIVRYVFDRISQGASVSIVGERRIGKTSLLHYIKSTIAMNRFGIDPQLFLFIYVDCFGLTRSCPRDFWLLLLQKMNELLLDRGVSETLNFLIRDLQASPDPEFFPFGEIAQLMQRIKAWGRQPVFLLDEFESVINSGSLDKEFLKPLRSLATSNPLTFVVATRDNLEVVCHSDLRGSPFFNIFGMRELHVFTEAEFHEWVSFRLKDTNVSFGEAEVNLFVPLAGRHPFFSEMLAYPLFYSVQENIALDQARLKLVEDFRVESRPHFDYYWDHSSEGEKVSLAILALKGTKSLRTTKYEDENLKSLLRRSLVLRESNGYSIFSYIFAQQIRDDVYTTIQSSPENFDSFVKNFKSDQPLERAQRLASSAKAAFLRINPRYWGIFLQYLLNRENPGALVEMLNSSSEVLRGN